MNNKLKMNKWMAVAHLFGGVITAGRRREEESDGQSDFAGAVHFDVVQQQRIAMDLARRRRANPRYGQTHRTQTALALTPLAATSLANAAVAGTAAAHYRRTRQSRPNTESYKLSFQFIISLRVFTFTMV